MPEIIVAEVLFRPAAPELRFLPEGPYPAGPERMSWVAIQHGADARCGSLNLYDFESGENRELVLPGRPGFAFPTTRIGTFVVGMERQLALVEIESGNVTTLAEEIDAAVENTIVNDGVCFTEGIVFGCKDLAFQSKKAGLYFWRRSDKRLIQLRNDQICSNGKVIAADGSGWVLLDIDTPTKKIQRYRLDAAAGILSEPEVALDLTAVEAFPDGMIATPDGQSVIISFYDPGDSEAGETRQYRLADGRLETIWRTPGSPRNTCPQLVQTGVAVKLVITTAVEHMTSEQQARHRNAGCLFVAQTPFDSLPETPRYEL